MAGPTSLRTPAMLGIGANLVFWTSIFGFAALYPGYSHATKAVSELGAWGAPNMWAFSVLGFIVPGLMLAACGWGIGRAVKSRWLAALLALSGVCIVVAGVFPANMDDMRSLTTVAHVVGAMGSLAIWAPAMIVATIVARKRAPALAIVSGVALALMVGAFFLYETLLPGLVQRITFAVFFGYFLVASLVAPRSAPTA